MGIDAANHVALVFGNVSRGGANVLVWRLFDADTLEPIFEGDATYATGPDGFVSQVVATGPNRFAAVVYPDGAASPAALYILHVPFRSSTTADAGADGARPDGGLDATSCWLPDGGAYDPDDPTAEGQRRVWEIARTASATIASQQSSDAGLPYSWSAPRTPSVPPTSCTTDPAGTWDTPEWRRVSFGFGPGESHRYSYQLDAIGSGNAAQFTARAIGDLDGDGTPSTFEVAGALDRDGGPVLGDLFVFHGLE